MHLAVYNDTIGRRDLRPKKETATFPVTLPSLIFGAYSNGFKGDSNPNDK